jgi:hypothetical protein
MIFHPILICVYIPVFVLIFFNVGDHDVERIFPVLHETVKYIMQVNTGLDMTG